MARRKAQLKGIKKRKSGYPVTERDKLFCERWLIHFDAARAHREAGFSASTNGTEGLNKLEKFAEYLRPIQQAKAKLVAERLMIDSDSVLDKMKAQVFYDPSEFYERTSEPLTTFVKVPRRKQMVEQTMTWDGQPVYGERLKPYSDLTPAQQAVVEITSTDGDRIHYRLPTIAERHQYLTSLGRQFGQFAERLIIERHKHQHVHAHLTFEGVPTQKLNAITRQLLPLVGLEFAQSLGYTAEDIDAAARDEGVLVPAH
jgi:hypothetical protein